MAGIGAQAPSDKQQSKERLQPVRDRRVVCVKFSNELALVMSGVYGAKPRCSAALVALKRLRGSPFWLC
jgi:hypothetical protein